MKKMLTIAITFVMIVMAGLTVNATTSAELADALYEKASAYGMTKDIKVRVNKYLTNYPVDEETANAILGKADEAIAVLEAAGVKSYTELEDTTELQRIANEAAKLAGVTIKVGKNNVITILRGKEVVDKFVIGKDGKILVYTGNNTAVVVVSSLAIIALVAIVAKRRLSVER